MVIKRTVNGVEKEFKLTFQERLDAYYEHLEHYYDVMDVKDEVDYLSDEQFLERYAVQKSAFMAIIDDVADEMRRNMDKYDLHWDSARDEAIWWGVGRLQNANN